MNNILLAGEQCEKAFNGEFEANFDHKPTQQEIMNIKLQLVAKAEAKHIFERLSELCTIPEHYGYLDHIPQDVPLRKRCKCPQCMAEFGKELIGEK